MNYQSAFKSLRVAAVALPIGLAACATPPAAKFPDITFSHLPKISVDVARIEVVDATTPSTAANRVEGRMPAQPKSALRNWARDRLQPVGAAGVAKFIIEDASVTETDLAVNKDFKATFTKEQAERYVGNVQVTLKLEGVPYLTTADATASANRVQTVREDATINQRETIQFEMIEALMREFDHAMAESMRRHLGNAVR